MVIMVMVLLVLTIMAVNPGKDEDPGVWINYRNIRVTWEIADCNGEGYQYWWEQDRDLDGLYSEGLVTVDYGKYGGTLTRDEGTSATDFGCEVGLLYYDSKVINKEVTWVPGVNVPGGSNKFVIKDNDGDGWYEGGFTTPLFWPGLSIPDGPYLFSQKFEYFDHVDETGKVTDGYYIEYQYFTMPGVGGAPSGGQ